MAIAGRPATRHFARPMATSDFRLTPCLTPHGRLLVVPSEDAPGLEPALGERIRQAFDRGAGHGLLRLGAGEVGQVLPPAFAYWRELGARHVTALCTRPDVDEQRGDLPPPSAEALEGLVMAAPIMPVCAAETAAGAAVAGRGVR